jgi:hypothetical protein
MLEHCGGHTVRLPSDYNGQLGWQVWAIERDFFGISSQICCPNFSVVILQSLYQTIETGEGLQTQPVCRAFVNLPAKF